MKIVKSVYELNISILLCMNLVSIACSILLADFRTFMCISFCVQFNWIRNSTKSLLVPPGNIFLVIHICTCVLRLLCLEVARKHPKQHAKDIAI